VHEAVLRLVDQVEELELTLVGVHVPEVPSCVLTEEGENEVATALVDGCGATVRLDRQHDGPVLRHQMAVDLLLTTDEVEHHVPADVSHAFEKAGDDLKSLLVVTPVLLAFAGRVTVALLVEIDRQVDDVMPAEPLVNERESIKDALIRLDTELSHVGLCYTRNTHFFSFLRGGPFWSYPHNKTLYPQKQIYFPPVYKNLKNPFKIERDTY
jgi:hypothetical protein